MGSGIAQREVIGCRGTTCKLKFGRRRALENH